MEFRCASLVEGKGLKVEIDEYFYHYTSYFLPITN